MVSTYLNMEWWQSKFQVKLQLFDRTVLPIDICVTLNSSDTTDTIFFFHIENTGVTPLLTDHQLQQMFISKIQRA